MEANMMLDWRRKASCSRRVAMSAVIADARANYILCQAVTHFAT